ncbi:flagellar hook capping FlgD N-terminal domain-containing protein [Bacillus mexicanus]|uniref:flagellar hook capping FlgD N-terminal domain-containing protein n=1 Tax=Bacillus mexicanus TaxID=2834415 RepID=UPI003D1A9FF9
MAVDNVTSPINSTTSTTSSDKSSSNNTTIDQEGFLSLLVSSLQSQDPLEPMSNSDMMQQMTQLAQIQNTNSMKEILEDLSESVKGQNPINNYVDLIGKKVKVETDSGYKEGNVLSVGKDGDDIIFELEDGTSQNVSSIVSVSKY